jgi:hypothetical protein
MRHRLGVAIGTTAALGLLVAGANAFLLPPPATTVAAPLGARSSSSSGLTTSSHHHHNRHRHRGLGPLRAVEDGENDVDDDTMASFFQQRGTLRPVFTLLVWLGFVLYAVDFAPGMGEAARAADQKLLTDLIADPLNPSVTPLFAMIFNMLGILPFIYTSLLLPGAREQKPVPAAPFCIGSFALGFFALGPFLALREFRPVPAPPKWGWLRAAVESKIPAVLAMVGALLLVKHGYLTGGGPELDLVGRVSEYKALFDTQMLVHVSSLDFLILSLFVGDALREDMMRRGWYDSAKVLAFSIVPVLGPCLYLILRPPLLDVVEGEDERGLEA